MREQLDAGRPFDWGRAAGDYAKFRDLYPESFYRTIYDLGIGCKGQDVLDIGTGTGVLPRNLYSRGGRWTGLDASDEQISEAERLSAGLNIAYLAGAAEDLPFADSSFDAVTAAQCFFYFDHDRLAPQLQRVLRPGGRLLITYLSWLPGEDELAFASEQLVLKHNPRWSGGGETFRPADVPAQYAGTFRVIKRAEQRLDLPFTRESWHGRMRACRGTGASLGREELEAWEREHLAMLERLAPDSFTVRHCFAFALLEKR